MLNPLELNPVDEIQFCEACQDQITLFEGPFLGCLKCNHYLHDRCVKSTPRSRQHPSHPDHPLTLHPTPTYSTHSFTFDACGSSGNGYSYGCAHCEFDLHLQCASLPFSIKISEGKHPHELKLTFDVRCCLKNKEALSACASCRGKLEENQWLYHCAECHIGMHLQCANSAQCSEKVKGGSTGQEELENGQNKLDAAQFMTELMNLRLQAEAQRIQFQCVSQAISGCRLWCIPFYLYKGCNSCT